MPILLSGQNQQTQRKKYGFCFEQWYQAVYESPFDTRTATLTANLPAQMYHVFYGYNSFTINSGVTVTQNLFVFANTININGSIDVRGKGNPGDNSFCMAIGSNLQLLYPMSSGYSGYVSYDRFLGMLGGGGLGIAGTPTHPKELLYTNIGVCGGMGQPSGGSGGGIVCLIGNQVNISGNITASVSNTGYGGTIIILAKSLTIGAVTLSASSYTGGYTGGLIIAWATDNFSSRATYNVSGTPSGSIYTGLYNPFV